MQNLPSYVYVGHMYFWKLQRTKLHSSCIQQIFREYLLYTSHWSKHWGYNSEQHTYIPSHVKLTCNGEANDKRNHTHILLM